MGQYPTIRIVLIGVKPVRDFCPMMYGMIDIPVLMVWICLDGGGGCDTVFEKNIPHVHIICKYPS